MRNLQVWSDGELLEMDSAKTELLAHGLHYGTGVFEGIRAYPTAKGPAIFRLADHMKRFAAGADALQMTVDVDAIGQGALELLRVNDQQSAYVRPLSFYETGGLGLDVGCLKVRSMVATLPWKSHLGDADEDTGVKLTVASRRRTPATSVPPLKLCGNYVNSILAKLEATKKGFDEALFVDDDGFVCEATGENVFLVKDGTITAVEHRDALPGITRATILTLTDAQSRAVHVSELRDADEVFLTGTSAEVARVSEFDGRVFEKNDVTKAVAELYQEVVHGRTRFSEQWLTWA
jgi:branched-chain amino acid aminotransferase